MNTLNKNIRNWIITEIKGYLTNSTNRVGNYHPWGWWGTENNGETDENNSSGKLLVCHKPHMKWPGLETGQVGEESMNKYHIDEVQCLTRDKWKPISQNTLFLCFLLLHFFLSLFLSFFILLSLFSFLSFFLFNLFPSFLLSLLIYFRLSSLPYLVFLLSVFHSLFICSFPSPSSFLHSFPFHFLLPSVFHFFLSFPLLLL